MLPKYEGNLYMWDVLNINRCGGTLDYTQRKYDMLNKITQRLVSQNVVLFIIINIVIIMVRTLR